MAIRYKTLTQKEYDSLATYETDLIYFVADTGKQYLNGVEYPEDADLSKQVIKDYDIKADLGSDSTLQVNGGAVVTVDAETGKIDPSLVPSVGGAEWGAITGTLADQTDLATALDGKANTVDLATVATSGSYNDLSNKPNLATVATSGSYNDLSDKPTLATVATSGSYNDLTDKPAIQTQYDWLCLTANEANSTVYIYKYTTSFDLEYSTDGTTWTTYTWDGTTGQTITLANAGDKVYFRGDNADTCDGGISNLYVQFHMSGSIKATGNVMSLLSKTCSKTEIPKFCFYQLFRGCSALTSANIFGEVKVLSGCGRIFQQCTSLTSIEIPTEVIVDHIDMMTSAFNGCSSLSRVKVGFHTWFTGTAWVKNVAATGTLICPSDLDCSTRSTSRVPEGWTVERTSAPQADWDESDSSDPAYIKGNPTQEDGKGFNINSSEGNQLLSLPSSRTGIRVFGTGGYGTTIIGGRELQLNGDGSKGISWNGVDNDINISCNNIKKSGNFPNTAGGFAIVDSSTGKLPASIVPQGDAYTDATSYTLTKNNAWRVTPSVAVEYYIDNMNSGDWVDIELAITGSWLSGENNADNIVFHANTSYNFRLGSHDPRCRAQRGKYRYRITYDGTYYYLLNEQGGIIQKHPSDTYPVDMMPFFWYDGDYQASEKLYHPISNDYATMPFGGYVSPLVSGGDAGIGFEASVSGQTLDFSDGVASMYQKYLPVHSYNPTIYVGDNTIERFGDLKTTLEPMLITVIGGSNGHCYLGSGSDDLLSSSYTFSVSNQKICQVWTGCYWDGNYWQRWFKTVKGTLNTSYYETTLPAEN